MNNRTTKTLDLNKGQYTTIPDNRNNVLAGPGSIELTRYGSGKLTAVILSGSTISREWAVKRKLERVSWNV